MPSDDLYETQGLLVGPAGKVIARATEVATAEARASWAAKNPRAAAVQLTTTQSLLTSQGPRCRRCQQHVTHTVDGLCAGCSEAAQMIVPAIETTCRICGGTGRVAVPEA